MSSVRNYMKVNGKEHVYLAFWKRITIALVMLILGVISIFYAYSLNSTNGYVKTKGVVVDYRDKLRDRKFVYSEKVEFYVDGEKYFCYSDVYRRHPMEKGSTIDVYYKKDNPEKSKTGVKHNNFIFYFAGVVFVVFGGAYLVLSIKDKASGNVSDDLAIK